MSERDIRRLLNTKENSIATIDNYPGDKNVPEGQFMFSHPKGKPVRLYKKLKGMLWWVNLTRDGNEVVERDLKVKGNIKGTLKARKLVLDKGNELTISSTGLISITKSWHTVNTYGGAATDNLDDIEGGVAGQILILTAADTTNTVVVRDDEGSGISNIMIGANFSLDDDDDSLLLFHNGNKWVGVSSMNNE